MDQLKRRQSLFSGNVIRNLILLVILGLLIPFFANKNASAITFITTIVGAGCRQFSFDGLAICAAALFALAKASHRLKYT